MQHEGAAALIVMTIFSRVFISTLPPKKRRRARKLADAMFKSLDKSPVKLGKSGLTTTGVGQLRAEQVAKNWWAKRRI